MTLAEPSTKKKKTENQHNNSLTLQSPAEQLNDNRVARVARNHSEADPAAPPPDKVEGTKVSNQVEKATNT
jgi:hypothetical protein